LHRKCMPPINGGNDCKGEAVLTEPCNEDPCPADPNDPDAP